MIYRSRYYYNNFVERTRHGIIVESGYCGLIIAYDTLIDCEGHWEKLICYSCIHPGDTNSTGALAGGLYALFYDWGDVPEDLLQQIEFKDELTKLGQALYVKYTN